MIFKKVEGMSAYGRDLEYGVIYTECDLCKIQKICMVSDGSDGEYCSFSICKECFLKEIDDPTNKPNE